MAETNPERRAIPSASETVPSPAMQSPTGQTVEISRSGTGRIVVDRAQLSKYLADGFTVVKG